MEEIEYEEYNESVYWLSIELEVDESEIEEDDEMMNDISLYEQKQITWDDLFARGEARYGTIEERGI
jgi:hypothetical protein